MQFSVPPFIVSLEITHDRPLNDYGEPVDAVSDFQAVKVLIWERIRGQRRRACLCEELANFWRAEYDHESWVTAFVQQFAIDLERQGGLRVLDLLRPPGAMATAAA